MRIETMAIEGLHCIDCAARVQAAVGQVTGVDHCLVDYASGKLTVYVDGPDLPIDDIAQAVSRAGYRLVLPEPEGKTRTDVGRSAVSAGFPGAMCCPVQRRP